MAIIDVRILRTLEVSESKADKQTIQLTGTQDLLFISDEKDPAFDSILDDESNWPNLGNAKVPQIDDEAVVKGVKVYVTSRKLSYYKDNERAVVMTIRYDAKAEEKEELPTPEQTDAETWQRITVASVPVTKPAVGWGTRALVPAENDAGDNGAGAQNSAGDPVDGLEEESSLVRYTYTNTQVLLPNFLELQRYTNRCNDGAFLGAEDYKVRMAGWSAEYDQKNNVWVVSVEFLYNPDGWQITYFDAGYNEIVDGERRAILDKAGNPVSKPVPLNGVGGAEVINGSPSEGQKPVTPVTLELYPYKVANMGALFANCGI